MLVEEIAMTPRTADSIANAIIDEIRLGTLRTGEVIPTERELCDRFSASRPTVREAIAQMQIRGFVDVGGGRRPRAILPNLLDVLSSAGEHIRYILGDAETGAHLEQMRQYIEAGAAREAALHANNSLLAKLSTALNDNFEAIGTKDFPKTDIEFHRQLVSFVGNPVMLTLHDMFVNSMLATRPTHVDAAKYDRIGYDEHRRIYEAIHAGDPQEATRVIDQHLTRAYRARLAPPKTV